uniref:Serpentine receptor class gamma n=1 Tax=Heterorhabditis bacteriophora TaxID=37862 RepID=A0A1I7X9J8_HETBA
MKRLNKFLLGFQNIWTYLNSYISLRIPQFTCGSCNLAGFLLSRKLTGIEIFHFFHYHFAYVQLFLTLFTCLNRCSMIYLPQTYEIVCLTIPYILSS